MGGKCYVNTAGARNRRGGLSFPPDRRNALEAAANTSGRDFLLSAPHARESHHACYKASASSTLGIFDASC